MVIYVGLLKSFLRSTHPCKKNGKKFVWGDEDMVAEYELDSKIFKKENLDICYFITGKKLLNGILHYKLNSGSSQEIYLSVFALRENFVSENKMCEQSNKSVSRLFTRIISKGYQTGKSNEK
ncbi:hypothetical protein OAU49_00480 [Alphaproteobacteria bacterium]|nr:hypothetical protein [Alphaproteobacteria bacterium]MDC3273098.1 hypothetical protein [Alphaproteobacteria bacterium]